MCASSVYLGMREPLILFLLVRERLERVFIHPKVQQPRDIRLGTSDLGYGKKVRDGEYVKKGRRGRISPYHAMCSYVVVCSTSLIPTLNLIFYECSIFWGLRALWYAERKSVEVNFFVTWRFFVPLSFFGGDQVCCCGVTIPKLAANGLSPPSHVPFTTP